MDPYPIPPADVAPILDRVSSRIAALAQQSAKDTHPAVQSLPEEIRDIEVPAMAKRYYPLTLRVLREGRPPTDDDLRALRDRTAQRAQEGVSLPLLLHLWQSGFQRFFAECQRVAAPDQHEALSYIATAQLRLEETIVAELVQAYQHEQAVLLSEQTGAPQLVARLLIDGQDARPDAERLNITLAERYDVLAVSVTATPDELAPHASGRIVAGQRKLHRMLRLVTPAGGHAALPLLDPAGGHILIPRVEGSAPSRSDGDEQAAKLVTAMQAAAGASITAAIIEDVDISELTAAAADALDVLNLARTLDRPPGLYHLYDIAVAYQLSRASPATKYLLALLAPLRESPELIATLRTYLACDLDRRRTARTLAIHPNTVNNRLNHIAETTADPFTVEGIIALHAALTTQTLHSRGLGRGQDGYAR